MSFFSNSKGVRVTGGSFQAIAGDQHINVHRDDPVQRWRMCVEIFDIVDSGNHYGIDYEIVRVKLEVERIRLLEWGNAVGFGITDQSTSKLDSRMDRNEFRGTVLRVLGCIHHVFEEAERLQERYGLRPVTPQDGNDELRPLPLASIFKRAYEPLLKLSKDRQNNSPLPQRRIWAIRDKKKFQEMIHEIKGFNDSLDQLFPDIKKFTSENMRNEIDRSEDVEALQSLQEATTDEHDDISEIAGDRLQAMGATAMADSQIGDVIGRRDAALQPVTANTEPIDEEDDAQEVREMANAVESFVSKKHQGRLTLSLIGPTRYSDTVSGHVYWDGERSEPPFWDEKGFLKSFHTSFDLYYKKTYTKKSRQDSYEYTDEGSILFDVESHSKHQNVNPGTVTVEGFGMECWSHEISFGKRREFTIMVSHAKLPNIPARKLLRRIDELSRGVHKFGWNPKQEEADLKEFFGKGLTVYYSIEALRLGDFFSMLNRQDIFADFTSKSSISMEWGGPREKNIGMWNLLFQIILAKELALRLGHKPDSGSCSGFTHRVLAALIVQDLWLRNIEIILTDAKILPRDIGQPLVTSLERTKAEAFKEKGNEAMKNGQWQKAVDFYTEALQLDHNHATYFSNRSAALLSLDRFEDALIDAYTATKLDPKYAKAWSRLGLAEIKLGHGSRAQHAYERAIQVAGADSTALMKQGLADAKAKIEADLKAIGEEKDEETKDLLRKDFLDQDWDLACKSVELHSRVHQQQVEGLLLFAERMGWPYINEVRDYAEDVYGNLRSGQTVAVDLHDWLFGMVLPGKWMSFKIMAALVLCTPSISASLNVAEYFDCGVSLPKKSYWRVRTVLGRVLGCLPNVISLCGWIGPCLVRVEFIPPLSEDAKKKPRYIHLNARNFSPITSPDDDDGVIYIGSRYDDTDAMRPQPDEDLPGWVAEIKDNDNWVSPQPPLREFVTCTTESIRLKKLPPDINIVAQRLSDEEMEAKAEYRASIVFSLDNNEDRVSYTLYTNPTFITVPPCHSGPHQVHIRELPRYQKDVWMVDRLKDHTPEDFDDDVMIINATGKGTEVLARAWCAERGKNAVIRRANGPCFVCAVRAAGEGGLGVGVLIWVS